MIKVALLVFSLLIAATAGAAKIEQETRCVSDEKNWWHGEQPIMGTEVRVELWHSDMSIACAAIDDVMTEMRRIERSMSPHIASSLISRLNRRAAQQPVIVGEELFDLIAASIRFSKMTDGAFDVTFASVGRFYDYRHDVLPDAIALAEGVKAIDYRHLELNPANFSIRYLHPGVYVDLGGIAKGYAVDRGIELLQSKGITQAVVGAGGDSRILGDRQGEPWIVGIVDPRKDNKMVAVLPLVDVSVSTSGDYERYFVKNGVRYHHIIDPQTGDSARDVRSVTILGNETVMTDALSTSVFVLGAVRGLELINSMADVDAIIVDDNGRMQVSNRLLEMVTLNEY